MALQERPFSSSSAYDGEVGGGWVGRGGGADGGNDKKNNIFQVPTDTVPSVSALSSSTFPITLSDTEYY